MKTKTKLAVLAVALSCSVVGMAAATTFAWFGSRSSVTATFSTITVNAKTTKLTAIIYPLGSTIGGTTNSQLLSSESGSYATNFQLEEVTSDFGTNFVKKVGDEFLPVAQEDIPSYAAVAGIAISNLQVGQDLSLRVSIDWAPKGQFRSEDIAAAANMRCAIWHCANASFDEAHTDGFRKVFINSTETDSLAFKTYDSTKGEAVNGSYQEGDYAVRGTDVPIVNVKNPSTHYMKFAYWMDGMISDNQDDARSGRTSLSITFSVA